MKNFRVLALFGALCAFGSISAQQPGSQPLTNDSVVQMKGAGMSDELIISTIQTQPGTYSVTLNDILGLKKAGVSDQVIVAMQQARAVAANTPPPSAPAGAPDGMPRVFLTSATHGNTWASIRDQTMELAKDFEKDCTAVHLTVNQNVADYTVALHHIEVGAFVRGNQMEISNHVGDVVGKTSDGGSISKGAKKACAAILEDWNPRHPPAPTVVGSTPPASSYPPSATSPNYPTNTVH